jgi:hypothetical protein
VTEIRITYCTFTFICMRGMVGVVVLMLTTLISAVAVMVWEEEEENRIDDA